MTKNFRAHLSECDAFGGHLSNSSYASATDHVRGPYTVTLGGPVFEIPGAKFGLGGERLSPPRNSESHTDPLPSSQRPPTRSSARSPCWQSTPSCRRSQATTRNGYALSSPLKKRLLTPFAAVPAHPVHLHLALGQNDDARSPALARRRQTRSQDRSPREVVCSRGVRQGPRSGELGDRQDHVGQGASDVGRWRGGGSGDCGGAFGGWDGGEERVAWSALESSSRQERKSSITQVIHYPTT